MKNKLLAAAIVGFLAVGAAACSSDTPKNATAECPEGVAKLTLLRAEGNPPTDDDISTWTSENTCVEIEVQEVPFGQLFERITVSASSDNPPDIYEYDGPQTQALAAQGVLMPLDEYLPESYFDDVFETTLEANTYDGKVYSPGMGEDAPALFFNKDLLSDTGITPPTELDEAWTWPEAMEAFQQCQRGDSGSPEVWGLAPSQYGDGQPGFMYRDLLFQRSAGDPSAPKDSSLYKTFWALSDDGTTTDGWLNTDEAIEALEFYQSMYEGSTQVTPKSGIPNAFLDGKACFDIQGAWLATEFEESAPDFEYGVTPLPYFKTPIVHTGAVTIGVSSQTEHPEIAAKFVVEVGTGKYALKRAEERRQLPHLKSVAESIPEINEYPMSIFVDSLQQWGQPRPPTPAFLQLDRIVTDALNDIALGSDPKSRMDQAIETLDPILGQGN